MPAPAARRIRRPTAPQRVVEEAEEGDPQQVGHPAAQFRREQVEVGAVVEEGERRQRDQGRGGQHGAQREGELGGAVVLSHQTGIEEPAHARRHDEQGDGDRDREPDPGHGALTGRAPPAAAGPAAGGRRTP